MKKLNFNGPIGANSSHKISTLGRPIPPNPSVLGVLFFLAGALVLSILLTYDSRTAADLVGTFIFGFTGALTALRHFNQGRSSDLIVFVAAILTAVGGGTIRTAFLPGDSLFWVEHSEYLLLALFGAALALLYHKNVQADTHSDNTWSSADRLALGIFAGIGADYALQLDSLAFQPLIAFFFAVLTGAGGGLVRDLLLRRMPTAISTTYGLAALVGGLTHYALVPFGYEYTWVVTALVTWFAAEVTQKVHFFKRKEVGSSTKL